MSATMVIRQSDALHLLSDAGVFAIDGSVTEVRSKLHVLPLAQAVMTYRASFVRADRTGWPDMLCPLLAVAPDFDTAMSWLPTVTEIVHRLYFGDDPHPDCPDVWPGMEVTLAGWSASAGRAVAVCIGTHSALDPDPGLKWVAEANYPGEPYQPFRVYEAPLFRAAPAIDLDAIGETVGFDVSAGVDLDALDIDQHGADFMELQRRHLHLFPNGEGHPMAAGFCEVATITADGVDRRVLREWPDMIGQPVRPA